MAAIVLRFPDDRRLVAEVPEGCNEHLCMAAVRDLMRGETPSFLTVAEAGFIAEITERLGREIPVEGAPA